MAHATSWAVLQAAVFIALQPHAAVAEAIVTAEPAAVVVHVRDYQGVPAHERAAAFRIASEVYRGAKVALRWTDLPRGNDADGLVHIDLVILNAEMSDQHRSNPTTFGVASHETKKAYVYYPRIARHCAAIGGETVRLLALVIAHELGHVLLAGESHSASGLMQGEWNGRIVSIPPFLASQARAIRAMVADWR